MLGRSTVSVAVAACRDIGSVPLADAVMLAGWLAGAWLHAAARWNCSYAGTVCVWCWWAGEVVGIGCVGGVLEALVQLASRVRRQAKLYMVGPWWEVSRGHQEDYYTCWLKCSGVHSSCVLSGSAAARCVVESRWLVSQRVRHLAGV